MVTRSWPHPHIRPSVTLFIDTSTLSGEVNSDVATPAMVTSIVYHMVIHLGYSSYGDLSYLVPCGPLV